MRSEAVTVPPGELILTITAFTRESLDAFFKASAKRPTGFSDDPNSPDLELSDITPVTSINATLG